MLTNVFMVLAGFFLLIKGADALVGGASSIARKLGIPSLVVGLTVVAFGTSAPEFFVNVIAASYGETDLAIGNVLGSNLANILFVLGVTALIAPLKLESNTVWKEIPFSLLAAGLVLVMGMDVFIDGGLANTIGRIDGIILWSFFLIFIVYTFGIREKTGEQPETPVEQFPLPKSIFLSIAGLAGLAVGGQLVVGGASAIALTLGVTANLVGLTVVALGTSLPELVASVVAAKKGHQDLAIGNVVGSGIFNIFFVLASTAIVAPIPFAEANIVDAFAVMIATLMLFLTIFAGNKHQIAKREGFVLVLMYLGFIAYAIFRG